MSAREDIAKLNRAINAIYQARCAHCGHAYHHHLTGLRCYETRCKCKAFTDRASTGEGENGCAR